MFYLKFIGCGAGFSKGLGNNSAVLYWDKPENGYFLIDCGESTRVKLVEMDLLPYLKGVFITHLHGDHIYGLEMLGFYWKFVLKKPLPLYLPSLDIWKELDKIFMPTMEHIQDNEGNPNRADFKDYFHSYIGPAFNLDENLYLNFVKANHVPEKECYGLQISIEDTTQYLYTGDQATPVEDIGYDMIWHDCSFYDQGKANVHAYIGDIEKAATGGKFKTPNNVYLMHYNHIPSEEKSHEVKKWCGGFVEPGSIFELE